MVFGSSISERNNMNCKVLAVAVWIAAALLPAAHVGAQAVGALPSPTTRREPELPQKILEKNPEFRRLLDPPAGEEFLHSYSQGYRDKSAGIEANAANLSDENLRARYRSDEWSYVPKKTLDLYKAQADAAFYQQKISFLREHRDAWFEIGQVKYDDVIKALLVKPLPGAATQANLRLVVSPDKMNQIYEQFRKIADAEIDEKTRAFVSKAAAGSVCANNREWCYSVKRDEVEQTVRAARMLLVGQGDLEAKKIDRLLLVDYVTETVFQEFDPHLSAADTLVWRLSAATESAPF